MKKSTESVFVVGIMRRGMTRRETMASLAELETLVTTGHGAVVGRTTQILRTVNPATLIGTGKVEEIRAALLSTDAQLVAIDDELTPVQNRNLEAVWKVRVLDRTAIILDIFALRAQSQAGKLQVELAQLQYLAPRLVGRGQWFSQQTGRIGTRGPGETALEVDRRRIRERITILKRRLEDVVRHRLIHRERREGVPIPLVSLVGYTNAGKSTLMNALTQADVFVEDRPFATLDPTVRRLKLPSRREVLVADTVGFIRRLPHQLVEAFRATFEEIAHSQLLVHVIDASDDDAARHVAVVEETLAELELHHQPRLNILNKLDRGPSRVTIPGAIAISAARVLGIARVTTALDEMLRRDFHRVTLVLPYDRGDILSLVYRFGHVWTTKPAGKGILVDCELHEKFVGKLKNYVLEIPADFSNL